MTGPSAPLVPTIVRSIPYSTGILVDWIVTAISYSSESYYIEYGLSSNSLTRRSEVLNGSTNLTETNLAYTLNISGLTPYTQYFYRLAARNTFTTSQTAVQMFQTSTAGNYRI